MSIDPCDELNIVNYVELSAKETGGRTIRRIKYLVFSSCSSLLKIHVLTLKATLSQYLKHPVHSPFFFAHLIPKSISKPYKN